jgi:hypothetical protein
VCVTAPDESVCAVVRVWLPDRPGALGLVASRIGAIRGDIVAVDVLERSGAIAVDEFAVELADRDLLALLVREIEEVDGASVEQVELVERFPDARLDALLLVERLGAATSPADVTSILTHECRAELLAEWTAVLRDDEVLATDGDAPRAEKLVALATGTAASPLVASGEAGPDELAIAPLSCNGALLLAERSRPRFRGTERAQLLAVARVADRVWSLVDHA